MSKFQTLTMLESCITSKMNLNQPLEAEKFYHIYNRGVNSEDLFKEDRNYSYFLDKYAQYLSPFVDTFSYCLLKNHFHILIRVKDQITLDNYYKTNGKNKGKKLVEGLHGSNFIVSKQFARLFSSYTQAINKSYNRTGSLIETPFKRIEVDNEDYITRLIWYIHFNPQKHGFIADYRKYAHSSYQSHLNVKSTKLARGEVLEWFGGMAEYRKFHSFQHEENMSKDITIE